MPDYSMGVEVTEHSYLRRGPSTDSEAVSEIAAGSQAIADPVEVAGEDGTSWYPIQYQMSEAVTLEGYIESSLVRVT